MASFTSVSTPLVTPTNTGVVGMFLFQWRRRKRRGTGQLATRVSGLLNILCYINEGLPNHAFTSELCHNECSTLPQCIIAIFPISFQVLTTIALTRVVRVIA